MKAIQYTIRNVPAAVDRYLRRRAQLTGKSLNQVILDELSDKVVSPPSSLKDDLSWFIGSGMDEATLQALQEEHVRQKEIARRKW